MSPPRDPAVKRPVAVLVHAVYDEDPRVRRQVAALTGAGWPVDVYALAGQGSRTATSLDGARVHRLPVRRHQGAGIATYLAEYLAFFARSGWAVTRAHRRCRYGLVQVHTLPDFLAFAGLPIKLAGVPLLLDLHEAMPEFYRVRFPSRTQAIAHRLLILQERLAISAADAVLTVNDSLAERLIALGTPAGKIEVILNAPDLRLFDLRRHPERPFMADGTLRLIYAGALTPIYELEIVLEAIARLKAVRPDLAIELDVYGRGDTRSLLRAKVVSLGLIGRVRLRGRIPLDAVPGEIAGADIGLAPTRKTPFTEWSLSTKIFEYAAMGKPVIASRLATVERYFPAGAVATYEPGDPDSLASVILRLVDDPAGRAAQVARTAEAARPHSWDAQARRYLALVKRLTAGVP